MAVPAALLSTVGVFVSTLLTGVAAYALFDLTWLEALLLGAVVASTDAAAVFATLRFTHIRRRLARTLEAESGGNDPMAIALTLGLIAWIEQPDDTGSPTSRCSSSSRSGSVSSSASCSAPPRRACSRGCPHSIGAFAPVASLAAAALSFGAADVIGGSGFLAVYIVGLAVGSTPSRYRRQLVAFHEGIAFLAQVALFVVLGLLVFPHDLPAVALSGLALALAAGVGRPAGRCLGLDGVQRLRIASGCCSGGPVCAAPSRSCSDLRALDRPARATIFNAVFFVVLVSTLVQGRRSRLARRLD